MVSGHSKVNEAALELFQVTKLATDIKKLQYLTHLTPAWKLKTKEQNYKGKKRFLT